MDFDKVANNLISLSKKKHLLVDEIYLLTEKQTIAIEKEDMEELTDLIDKKQRAIDNIEDLDIQFEAIVSDLKTVYEVKRLDELEVHSPKILELKDEVAGVDFRIREISALEEENKEKIIISRDALGLKIQHAANGKKAIKQYGSLKNYTDAYFIDKKIK